MLRPADGDVLSGYSKFSATRRLFNDEQVEIYVEILEANPFAQSRRHNR